MDLSGWEIDLIRTSTAGNGPTVGSFSSVSSFMRRLLMMPISFWFVFPFCWWLWRREKREVRDE